MKQFCIVCIFLFAQMNLFSSHLAGAELIYRLVPGSSNSYIFTLKLYKDCGPTGSLSQIEPASVTLCYKNSCFNIDSQIVLPKIIGTIPTTPPSLNGSEVYNPCSNSTTCTNINSPIHGYREWWYEDTLTLPVTCNAWTFYVSMCCTNGLTGNITPPAQAHNLYVESGFDNSIYPLNSSPVFQYAKTYSKTPVPFPSINMPYIHDGGILDADNDSLVVETTYPLTKNGCGSATPTNILQPIYNILDTAGNPFPTQNTYNLNKQNGHFAFVLSQLGYFNLAQKIKEYRNGQYVGYVMRTMQIKPEFNGNFKADTIHVCKGSSYTFPDMTVINNVQSDTIHYSQLVNAQGCDSIILTFIDAVEFPTTLTINGTLITSDETDSTATYQWIQCNSSLVIAGATSQSIVATSGIDYAVIISKYGCSDTSQCAQIQVATPVQQVEKKVFEIYPNPTTSSLNITHVMQSGEVLKLYNITGELVLNSTKNTMDVSNLAKGLYYLRLNNQIKKVFIK